MDEIISVIDSLFPESCPSSPLTHSKLKINVEVLSHSVCISSPLLINVMIFGNAQSPIYTLILEVP